MGVFFVKEPVNIFFCFFLLTLLDWNTSIVESAEVLSTFAFSVRNEVTFEDVRTASNILFLEKMNPYISSPNNLLVIYDDEIKGNEKNLNGFGQIRPLGSPILADSEERERIQYHEIASIYVKPDYRHQGVGSSIVRELIKRFDNEASLGRRTNPVKHVVCTLTLKPTVKFYSKFGFCVMPQNSIPPPLKLEYQLGNILSFILGNDLVCMVRQDDGGS
jgi:ribosomal protein S18 acetylase RimI-like enzyme